MTRKEESKAWTFLRHLPCDSCGSSDAAAEYAEGHSWCHRCGAYKKLGDTTNALGGSASVASGGRKSTVSGKLIQGDVRGLRARNITDATCQHFNYQVGEYRGKPVQIANYYSEEGLVAQKIRTPNKDFIWVGDSSKVLPFGSQAFPKSGKMIVVTEGEIDALSMSQVQGNKWPVVSIPCGAGAQTKGYFAKHRDYFLAFEKVVLMFDSDEPGRKAAKEAAEVLGRRAAIAELPLKDANEMLLAGRTEELLKAMWNAKEYRPEGIVELSTLEERVRTPPELGLSWWSEKLTKLTYGIRLGEIYAFGAGTGVGKTDFFTQQIAHMVTQHKVPIGVFSLEQGIVETSKRIAGKLAGKTFHIPDSGWTTADLDAAWSKLKSAGKVFLYDSFGVNEWDTIRQKIEFLCHAEGVRYFFLDHLTALAAAEDDERVALEHIMASMGELVKALNCTIFLVSHLSTPEGKAHEEGGRVSLKQFKGSRSIGYWTHYAFGLERDQQADDEATRQVTTFRVLKDRYTGRSTGQTMHLGYDHKTGMLAEVEAPDAGEKHGFRDETPGDKPGERSDF